MVLMMLIEYLFIYIEAFAREYGPSYINGNYQSPPLLLGTFLKKCLKVGVTLWILTIVILLLQAHCHSFILDNRRLVEYFHTKISY